MVHRDCIDTRSLFELRNVRRPADPRRLLPNLLSRFSNWRERAQGRHLLLQLDDRMLRDVGLSREVIATALHTEVYDIFPSDYESVQKSLMEGKPAPSSTTFGKSIMQLADKLNGGRGEPPSKKKSSSLGGLLGLFTKTSK